MGFPKASLPWLGVLEPGSKTLLPVPHYSWGVTCYPKLTAAPATYTLWSRFFFLNLGRVRWIIANAQRSCKVGAENSRLQLLAFDTCFFFSLKL